MSGIRIELADPQGQLLEEIADKRFTRRDVAMTYRIAVRRGGGDRVDWPKVNRAIIDRWSVSALIYIKKLAWSA
jgi:hypothetical protein